MKNFILLFIFINAISVFSHEFKKVSDIPNDYINSMKCIDDSTCLVFTENKFTGFDNVDRRLLISKDYGRSWKTIFKDTLAYIYSIAQVSKERIILNREPGGFWVSEDMGENWKLIWFNNDTSYLSYDYLPDGTWLILKQKFNSFNMIFMSISFDHGESWKDYNFPGMDKIPEIRQSKIISKDLAIFQIRDPETKQHYLLRVEDEFKKSTRIEMPHISVDDRYASFILDENNIWFMDSDIESDQFRLYNTKNGGENWKLIYTISDIKTLFSLTFADEMNGILDGNWNYNYITDDGGHTWSKFYVEGKEFADTTDKINIRFKEFPSADYAYAILEKKDLNTPNDTLYRLDLKGTSVEYQMPETAERDGVYPNPSTIGEGVNISFKNSEENKLSYKIYDILGNEYLSKEILFVNKGRQELYIEGSEALPRGRYYIVLQIGDKKQMENFIIE